MPDIFQKDEVIRLRASFRTPKTAVPPSELFDPATVDIKIQLPDKTSATYTYGVDTEVVKESTGIYYLLLPLTQEGTYHWRWRGGSGLTASGIQAGSFDARQEPNF